MTHKRLLLFLFLSLVFLTGRAQFVEPLAPRPEFKRSWGLTFGGGAYHTMAYSPNAKLVTGMLSLDLKRQFTPTVSIGLEGNLLLQNRNLLQSHSARGLIYIYGGINLFNLFVTPPIEPRRVELDGLVSLGWGHNFKEEAANRDLGASYLVSKLGLNLSWYLNAERSWALNVRPALFYDLRTDKENSQIEYNIHKASMMLSVGFTYRWIGEKRSRRRTYLHGLKDEEDESELVVNDTVRTMYVFPRLASGARRSRFRTLPTPSVALNPVQRADLRPTARVASGKELPGNYYVDSVGHLMSGDRKNMVTLPKSGALKSQNVESSRSSAPVVYGENRETGAPLEPRGENVMVVPHSSVALSSTNVRSEGAKIPTDSVARAVRAGTPRRGSETSMPLKQTAPATSVVPAKSRGVKRRSPDTGSSRSVEKVDHPQTEHSELSVSQSVDKSGSTTRREQGAVETPRPVAPRMVMETPEPVARVPELDFGNQAAMSRQNKKNVSDNEAADETVRDAPAPKVRTEEFDVYFAAGSAVVNGSPLEEVVRLVNYLRRNPSTKVTLAGYVAGGENRVLARRRAEVVRALLVGRYGVDARRIRTAAYGVAYFSSQPAKNRVVVAHAGR